MLGDLPLLNSMMLQICDVNPVVLPQIFAICSRLKSLTISLCEMIWPSPQAQEPNSIEKFERNWRSQHNAHNSSSTYTLKELSISWDCGIGLWGFISRSPHLKVLNISPNPFWLYHDTEVYELKRMYDLVRCFKLKDSLPSLEHLDLSVYAVNDELLSEVISTSRCLRSFRCQKGRLLSLHDFRPHFSTLTAIDVRTGTPKFWQGIMSSCPGLVKAKSVILYAEDIIRGARWASTRLRKLSLTVLVRPNDINEVSTLKLVQGALFQRIAELVRISHLLVEVEWRERTSLDAQNWEALSKIKTLICLEFGPGFLIPLDESTVARISTLKGLEWIRAYWKRNYNAQTLIDKIESLGVDFDDMEDEEEDEE
jgi:hypothetical protein